MGNRPSTPTTKTFKRGEVLHRSGDPVTHVFLILTGLASVVIRRGETFIEISQVPAGQLLGEEALWGSATWNTTAVAGNDMQALPIEISEIRALIDACPPFLKLVSKSMIARQKACAEAIVEIKLEQDPTPCPTDKITKLFSVIHQVVSYTGTKKGDEIKIVWPAFKKYCQRAFLESPVRLEQAINILVKQGCARLEMIPCETDPDAPDELGFVHFKNLDRVREFAKFSRIYFGSGESDPSAPVSESNQAILQEIEAWNAKGKVELTGT